MKRICFFDERFSFKSEFLTNIILMCYIGYTSLSFILKKGPYLRKSYFRKLCTVIDMEKTQNCLKRNENVIRKSNYSSKMISLGNKASTEQKKHIRPNYFVAVQVTDKQVHSSVKLIQDHMLLQNHQLTKSMISRSTLHITLMVMHIKNAEEHSKAIKALSTVHQEYNNIISKEPLKLEFHGVGHFQNRVVYVKLKKNHSYQLLCDLAKKICINLEMVGIFSTDRRKEFTPHLTIAKLDFTEKSLKKIKKFNPILYEDFTDIYFGCDDVKCIQLLKMHGPKTALGYYSGDELLFCSNDKIVWKKLNALLAIADKKKEIRSKISKLTKKLPQ